MAAFSRLGAGSLELGGLEAIDVDVAKALSGVRGLLTLGVRSLSDEAAEALGATRWQVVRPSEVIGDLLGFVFRIKTLFDGLAALLLRGRLLWLLAVMALAGLALVPYVNGL